MTIKIERIGADKLTRPLALEILGLQNAVWPTEEDPNSQCNRSEGGFGVGKMDVFRIAHLDLASYSRGFQKRTERHRYVRLRYESDTPT